MYFSPKTIAVVAALMSVAAAAPVQSNAGLQARAKAEAQPEAWKGETIPPFATEEGLERRASPEKGAQIVGTGKTIPPLSVEKRAKAEAQPELWKGETIPPLAAEDLSKRAKAEAQPETIVGDNDFSYKFWMVPSKREAARSEVQPEGIIAEDFKVKNWSKQQEKRAKVEQQPEGIIDDDKFSWRNWQDRVAEESGNEKREAARSEVQPEGAIGEGTYGPRRWEINQKREAARSEVQPEAIGAKKFTGDNWHHASMKAETQPEKRAVNMKAEPQPEAMKAETQPEKRAVDSKPKNYNMLAWGGKTPTVQSEPEDEVRPEAKAEKREAHAADFNEARWNGSPEPVQGL